VTEVGGVLDKTNARNVNCSACSMAVRTVGTITRAPMYPFGRNALAGKKLVAL